MRARKKVAFSILLFALLIVSFGCQKKAIVQTDTAQQSKQPVAQRQEVPKDKITEQKIDSKIESVDSRDASQKYIEERDGMFQDILFDYDKYDIKDTYKSSLQSVSVWLSKNGTAKISIEGYCDERGTNEYNLALGDRRAKAVRDYLIAHGVQSSRIEMISYGEEKPVCKESTEECWAKNRRAHIVKLVRAGKK